MGRKNLSVSHSRHSTSISFLSLSLILTCQISRSFSLTGSPTHNCVFALRVEGGMWAASKQASKQRLLCSFGPIDRISMTGLKGCCSSHCMLLQDIFTSTRENKMQRLPLFEATKTFLRLCFNGKCPPFCISCWVRCQPRRSYIFSLCVCVFCVCVMQLFLSFI